MPKFAVRPYQAGDAVLLYNAVQASMHEVGRWLPWCSPEYRLEDAQQWVAMCRENWDTHTAFAFVITDAETGDVVGDAGLNSIDWQNRWANLGYWVRTDRTRQGAASSAVAQVARYGLEEQRLQRCEIVAAAGNIASQRTAERAGAQKEGILRNRLFLHGKHHDGVVYSLTNEAPDRTRELSLPVSAQRRRNRKPAPFEIRPYTIDDVLAHWEAVSESADQLAPWMPFFDQEYGIEQAEEYCQNSVEAWRTSSRFAFAIIDTRDQSFVGNCEIGHLNDIHKTARLGYWIRSSRTRQGAASTAVRKTISFAFDHLKLARCGFIIAEGNLASQHTALASGAVCEALLRNRLWLHGTPHHAFSFSLIPSDLD